MSALCPVLGRPTPTDPTPFASGDFRLVRCRETGFVYLENPPSYDEVRDDFPWEVTAAEERTRRRRAEPIVSRVSDAVKRFKTRYLSKRNRMYRLAERAVQSVPRDRSLTLLDIGCGCGGLAIDCCDRFAESGRSVTPIGIELSEALADAAAERLKPYSGRVISEAALHGVEQIEEGSVDVALMASFLEHDPKPLELLVALRSKLGPDGSVVLKVPNFACLNRRVRGERWCGFRYPDHVNYFTPTTLRRLAAEAGYRAEAGTWADTVPLSDNMYAVLRPVA